MNHRNRLAPPGLFSRHRKSSQFLVLVTLLAVFGAFPVPVLAQRLPGLKPEQKTAVDARPFAAEIKAFVATQVTAMADDKNTALQQRARDALVKESGPGGVQPSASYIDVYATAVNEQFMKLPANASVRTRVNAAVALQRIARNTSSPRLAPSATRFVQDPCLAVVLWSTKSSQVIVPALAAAGTKDKLTSALVDAAKKYADNGDLIEEAYKGLTLDMKVNEKSAAVVTADLLRLLQWRVEQYAKTTPPRPELDRRAVNFLTLSGLWSTPEGVKHRDAILQQISNLAGVAAQHAAARPETERREYVETLRYVGDALSALGGRREVNDSNIAAAGKALSELQPSMAEAEFTDRQSAVFKALKAKFPSIQPPPKIAEDAVKPLESELAEEGDDAAAKPAAAVGDDAGKAAVAPETPAAVSAPRPR